MIAITLKPLTVEVNSNDHLVIVSPVKGWNMLSSK